MKGGPLPCPPGKGFSLLEVLVAMAILSMAFAALYASVGQSSRNAAAVDERMHAALVARSVLASATYAEDLPAQVDADDGSWRWEARTVASQASIAPGPEGAAAAQSVARVDIRILRNNRPILDWVGWKPYRGAP